MMFVVHKFLHEETFTVIKAFITHMNRYPILCVFGKVWKIWYSYILIRWPLRRKVSGHQRQNHIQIIKDPSTIQRKTEIVVARNLINLDIVLFFPFRCVNVVIREADQCLWTSFIFVLSQPFHPFNPISNPYSLFNWQAADRSANSQIVEKSHLEMLHVLTWDR